MFGNPTSGNGYFFFEIEGGFGGGVQGSKKVRSSGCMIMMFGRTSSTVLPFEADEKTSEIRATISSDGSMPIDVINAHYCVANI